MEKNLYDIGLKRICCKRKALYRSDGDEEGIIWGVYYGGVIMSLWYFGCFWDKVGICGEV